MYFTRRQFMKASAGTIAALAIADKALALTALQPVIEVGNPLGEYPDRSWERVYHDQYRYDSSFTYICTPNDTHGCRVRAFVRNGVVMRVEQNYDHQTYEDLYGNRGTFAWNPRMCLKGYTFHRRVYGPYRLKGPMLRKGWKQWVDDGCPEMAPDVKNRYRFNTRGEDDMLRVSWDTIGTYVAKSFIKIGERYAGEAGARRLREQGDPPEMVGATKGGGTRTVKLRPGMWLLGPVGEIGIGRMDSIAPEYNPPATKSDYWIPIRPGGDGALFLGMMKIFIDENLYDADFCKQFTDMPILVRTDTLTYLDPRDVIKDYKLADLKGYTLKVQAIKDADRERLGDFMVWDTVKKQAIPMHRELLGVHQTKAGIDPALEGTYRVTLLDGKSVDVMPVFQMYKIHVQDFDLDTTAQITNSPKDLIVRYARDSGTIKPMQLHNGEGTNHWFHMTANARGAAMICIVTGNVGKFGTGQHTWAGNFKTDIPHGTPWSGAGIGAWGGEDPFNLNLEAAAHGKEIKTKGYSYGDEPAYWNHGDRALIVNTPKYGRKVFTGKTHMPTPTKVEYTVNVNFLNNSKYHYDMVKNVDPSVECIIVQDLEMTSGVNYADAAFAINSWMEMTYPEATATVSNPWWQVWKGGIKPLYDTRNDLDCYSVISAKLAEMTGDKRQNDVWKFVNENKVDVYLQRIHDASSTLYGYNAKTLIQSEKGWFVMVRTYPREPFWEMVNESKPMWTRTGRFENYRIEPECIEYGENLIVHREDPEGTPYLPNVIISSSPFVRPDDYGIPITAMHHDDRHVRNTKLPWNEAKRHVNPLWEKGYQFYCVTPKTRHRVHSQWSVNDWIQMYESNFGDAYRMDKRTPGIGEHQMHVNPQAAKDRGINDGDYIYVDANPADRPYRGWKPSDPFYKVSRLMIRCKYNPAFPYPVPSVWHRPVCVTPKSVKGHETRPDGRAIAADTGYQSNFRYGAQQSVTRSWLMPMHQLDSLPCKKKHVHAIKFGFEADNHAVNTTPKSTLVRVSKAEDGGIGARGPWEPVRTGFTPAQENEWMLKWLKGESIKIKV